MNRCYASEIMKRLAQRLYLLYGEDDLLKFERMAMLVGRYGVGEKLPAVQGRWSQGDVVLITYGDSIRSPCEHPLSTLGKFAVERLGGSLNTLHILPFFPSSSDDGFSVIHYRQVDPALGEWRDIEDLRVNFHLMFDLVLNHVSRGSGWFRDRELGIAPGRAYFIEPDPAWDLSKVVRPRSSPLLSPVQLRDGLKQVWTTFSADQVDLNFANPDVLFEILDVLLFYISSGARIIRLDAVAYLWKRAGTSCIHLPETHEVVKIMRDLLDMVAPNVVLLTETNVPHHENISYFGSGDEAHMVYQFSLPPLALHAALTGRATYLTEWALGLADPPPGCAFLNFTASHDGIGVRPLEGLVPEKEIAALVEAVKLRGGRVSTRSTEDGADRPYELNITYFDAVSFPDEPGSERHVNRFLATQAVMLVLKGVPAVYLNSLIGAPNNHELVEETGRARSINRTKWNLADLVTTLDDQGSVAFRVMGRYLKMIRIRTKSPAFHPDAAQRVLVLDARIFAVVRTSEKGGEKIVAFTNFSQDAVVLAAKTLADAGIRLAGPDLLAQTRPLAGGDLCLEPFAIAWFSL